MLDMLIKLLKIKLMMLNYDCVSKSHLCLKQLSENCKLLFSSIAVILFLCMNSNIAIAQNPAPPTDSYINFDNGTGLLYVAIADSNNVSEIEVGIGAKGNYSDIFSHTYVYDQSAGLPAGLTYARTNLNVFLGVGALSVPAAYNVQVRIKNSNGNWSTWYKYVSN